MDAVAECGIKLVSARERLIEELREHALVIGEVTLTSGARADYYVDAKRAILRPAGFAAQATGSAPIVKPPTAVPCHSCTWAATSVASAAKPSGRRMARFAST